MKLKKSILIICFLLLFLLPAFSGIYANTVFPYKNEVVISNQERTKESVSFKNDGKKDVNILPSVYSYNPQTLEISDSQSYIFVRSDIEIFKVEPGEVLKLNYEVIPPQNIEPGTYFNIIILRTQPEDTFLDQTNPVGAIDNLSHLVVLHVTDTESSVYGITTEFAQISLEVIEKGIPFIRPARVKYTYQNITNYVLNPMGEIQVYNKKGSYSPVYIKINSQEEKLYPGGVMEEEFEIDKYDITDIYNERTVVGRFYNGIDENFILKETVIEVNYIILGLGALLVISFVVLIKAISKDRKNSKEKSA